MTDAVEVVGVKITGHGSGSPGVSSTTHLRWFMACLRKDHSARLSCQGSELRRRGNHQSSSMPSPLVRGSTHPVTDRNKMPIEPTILTVPCALLRTKFVPEDQNFNNWGPDYARFTRLFSIQLDDRYFGGLFWWALIVRYSSTVTTLPTIHQMSPPQATYSGPASGRSTRVEHEYFREGTWTYLAAWDVHRAKVFGRCEKKSGIAPVDRLIKEVMSHEPYKTARRVFWIVDDWSAHRGPKGGRPPSLTMAQRASCSTRRSMPVGSIRLKSVSPLSRGRCVRPMISNPSMNLNSAC